jgi:Tfp pilus assembly protein PilN
VKAVNLIPRDGRRGIHGPRGLGFSPTYLVLALLGLALVFVTVYVLTANSVSDRKARLVSLQAQLSAQQAAANRLAAYVQFEKLAQTRAATVRQIASARFDWYRALSQLSRVVPANTSLQTLTGTVAPGASAAGPTGSGASTLRSDISVPAFELTGCTKTQDDVARLMSRLRLINGVTRVTLGSSQKPGSAAAGSTVGAASSGGCGANAPAFDLIVFFQSLPNAGPTGLVAPQPTAASPGQSGTGATSQTTSASPSQQASTTTGGSK